MTADERSLAEDRAIRDAAREVFAARLERVRTALTPRGIGSRAVDEVRVRTRAAADETVAIARDYRWVVAGTLVAVVAWLARRPIAAGARRIAARVRTGEPGSRWPRWRAWAIGVAQRLKR